MRDDVQEEFAFHLDMRVDDLMRRAVRSRCSGAGTAASSAIRTRGAAACAREGRPWSDRERWRDCVSELRQDATFGLRLLGRSPGFSTVAILTLAVAIGGNTAIFSLVNAIALKPLAGRARRDEVVRIYTGESQTSWLNYQDIAQRTHGVHRRRGPRRHVRRADDRQLSCPARAAKRRRPTT